MVSPSYYTTVTINNPTVSLFFTVRPRQNFVSKDKISIQEPTSAFTSLFNAYNMTLSSSSRQHRKSMLPTPRLSSRLGSRRVALSDTSRITRRVPSPLLATPYDNGSSAQARIPQPAAANHNLPLPELGTRQAGAPSRIPGPSGQTSCPTPEQCDASYLTGISTPRPEVKRAADILYPTPPPSAEPKDEQRQERRATSVQKQEPEPRNPAASSARRPHHNAVTKRPTSTAFAVGFSRVENTVTSPSDASAALAQKRSALTSSVSEKENRRPHIRTRVPAPPVAASASASAAPVTVVISVPQPRCIRRMVAVVAPPSRVSFRETLPRPLVIQKRPSHSSEVSSSQGDSRVKLTAAAVAAPVVVVIPAGINALIEDIDRFAKEWTDMFDELSAGPERGPSKLISSMRIYPTGQSKGAYIHQFDDPVAEDRHTNSCWQRPSDPLHPLEPSKRQHWMVQVEQVCSTEIMPWSSTLLWKIGRLVTTTPLSSSCQYS